MGRHDVSSLYGDYIDQSGQVVMQNVESDKDPRPRGTIFRGAAMPYFLRIHRGIGMHAGYLPGYPASHGCIRLPEKMAVQFFKNAVVGIPVEIRQVVPLDDEPSPISERYSDFSSLLDRSKFRSREFKVTLRAMNSVRGHPNRNRELSRSVSRVKLPEFTMSNLNETAEQKRLNEARGQKLTWKNKLLSRERPFDPDIAIVWLTGS